MKRILFLIPLVVAVPASAQDTTAVGQKWLGGSLGFSSMGGDFTGVSGGPMLRMIGGYVGQSGLGVATAVHVSGHGTKDRDLNPMLLGHVLVGPRYMLGGLGKEANLFLGAHALLSAWAIQMPNPITLENTEVSAVGYGAGFSFGLTGVVGRTVNVEIEVGYNSVNYGDAGTEAYTFTNTSSHSKQWSIQLGFAKTWKMRRIR